MFPGNFLFPVNFFPDACKHWGFALHITECHLYGLYKNPSGFSFLVSKFSNLLIPIYDKDHGICLMKKALLHFPSKQNLCVMKLWTRHLLGIAKACTVFIECETHHHSTLIELLSRYHATQIPRRGLDQNPPYSSATTWGVHPIALVLPIWI